MTANSVVGVELVDAEGQLVRADADSHPELFWALRGGGGSFGVVTQVELGLLELSELFAGMMTWDIGRAPDVLRAFAEWSPTVPEEVTASCRVMRFPPLEELPPFLRGRALVVLDAAMLLDDDRAAAELSRFRALVPELDTFHRIPAKELTTLHMDPPEPTPALGDGLVLSHLDEAAVSTLLAHVGEGADTAVTVLELRLLGGAVSRPGDGGGALDHLPGSHLALLICVVPTPEAGTAAEAEVTEILADLAPWDTGRRLTNFTDRPAEAARGFPTEVWQRLQEVKRAVDPDGRFLANHAVR